MWEALNILNRAGFFWVLIDVLIKIGHVWLRSRIKFIANLLLKHNWIMSYWLLLLYRIKSWGVVRVIVTRGKGLLVSIEWICHKLLLLILILLLISIKLRSVITIDSNKILLLLLRLGGSFWYLNIGEEGVRARILIPCVLLVREDLIL